LDEVFHRLAIAVPQHGKWVAPALHDVLGGAVTHQADAEKADPR
jgi:hypothetical protein